MLTLVIKESFEKACHSIQKASSLTEAFEIRLDLIEDLSMEKLAFLRHLTDKKIIFTLRTQGQGGAFLGSFEEYKITIFNALQLKPHYIDIELGVPQQMIDAIKLQFPLTKVILSSHYFTLIPSIRVGFKKLFNYQADIYKLVIGGGPLEALDMLLFTKKLAKKQMSVIGIVMGERGIISRILYKIARNYLTFCSQNSSLGQLSVEEMTDVYHVHTTSTHTKVFGLIGNPITASPSHLTHNKLFQQHQKDAIYVKIELEKKELAPFLHKAKKLFEGLSITAPFKEKALELIENATKEAKKIGAINTVKKTCNGWLGENTDRLGAIQSLNQRIDIKNKRCLILGAGGACKAILYELIKAKAHVTILNRSKGKKGLPYKTDYYSFDQILQMKKGLFDIIIQATSCELHGELLPEEVYILFKNKPLVFETLINPRLTVFLQKALDHKCPTIEGYQMFLHQAAFQFGFWFNTLKAQQVFKDLQSHYLSFKRFEAS